MASLKAISLFSGIGGIDLAFAIAGFDIVVQIEINEFCRKVLRKHAQKYWKNAALYADVFDCGIGRKHELPAADVVFGGFPCQDISQAGKRAGIRAGERSGLWREMRRVISEVRPRIVFIENVDAIIHKGRGGTDVIAELTALGYVGQFGIISAADAGAPHLRKRWWLVAYPASTGETEISAEPGESGRHEERHNPAAEQSWYNESVESVNPGKVGNANGTGWQAASRRAESSGQFVTAGTDERSRGQGFISQSRMGGDAHGVSARLDGLMQHQFPAPPVYEQFACEPARTTLDRSEERLTALGNAVVPQVVYPIAVELYRRLR